MSITDILPSLKSLSISAPFQTVFQNIEERGEEGPIFIGSNEACIDKTLKKIPLLTKAIEGGPRLHIGVSGLYNYDIALRVHADAILIIDINPRVKELHEATIKTIKENATRVAFRKSIEVFLSVFLQKNKVYLTRLEDGKPKRITYNHKNTQCIQSLVKEILDNGFDQATSWLYSDETYNRIRTLVQKGNIAVLTADIGNSDTMTKVAELVKRSKMIPTSVYISNVAEWIAPFGITAKSLLQLQTLKSNIDTLAQSNGNTVIIDSTRSSDWNSNELEQGSAMLRSWSPRI